MDRNIGSSLFVVQDIKEGKNLTSDKKSLLDGYEAVPVYNQEVGNEIISPPKIVKTEKILENLA